MKLLVGMTNAVFSSLWVQYKHVKGWMHSWNSLDSLQLVGLTYVDHMPINAGHVTKFLLAVVIEA